MSDQEPQAPQPTSAFLSKNQSESGNNFSVDAKPPRILGKGKEKFSVPQAFEELNTEAIQQMFEGN